MTTRIALYSHDSVGLGHTRRNLAVAHALTQAWPELAGEPVSGLLITGQPHATGEQVPDGWDWIVVPGLARTAGGYTPRQLRMPLDELTSMRGNIVGAALEDFEPDLVVVDRHPFGVDDELRGALHQLRATRPDCAIVLGLRDVLDDPAKTAGEWEAVGGPAAIRPVFDAIWVYGDPDAYDPVATGEIPEGLADLAVHTGYLAHGRPEPQSTEVERPYIVTMVGGGSDGFGLAAAAAAAKLPRNHRHLVITGPQMPAEHHEAVAEAAGPDTEVVSSVPDAHALLRHAAAAVCMGGYNTVCEVMTTRTPALVVPRAQRRQEQPRRAAALAERSLIETLPLTEATPEAISGWLHEAVTRRVDRVDIDLDGLARLGPLAADVITHRHTLQEAAPYVV